MQRPLWYRVLVGFWGLWFITALTAPAVLHACPVHTDHMGHAAPMSAAMHHSHHMAQPRPLDDGRDAGRMDAGRTQLDAPGGQTSACCTCLGSCCCSAGTVSAASSAAACLAPIVRPTHALPVAYAMPARTLIAFAHPFAHGPPAVSETLIG